MTRLTHLTDGAGTKAVVAVSLIDTSGGCKIAYGTTAFDGSNPTSVATGLTTIVGFAATINDTDGVGSGTAFITYGTASGGTMPVYAWVVAGTASTGTETFSWIAIGT